MVGVPARRIGWMCQCGERLPDSGVGHVRRVRNDVRARAATGSRPSPARMSADIHEQAVISRRPRRLRTHQQESLRRDSRASTGSRSPPSATSTPSARSRPGREQGVPVVRVARRDAARRRRATSCRSARRPGCTRRRASSAARAGKHVVTRKADGDLARAGRRAGAGVRRRGRPAVRREAEPAQSADSAAEARRRQGTLRPDLHGERHGALAAAAGVLRRRAVARHVGVRRRRDHEPGVALRRPDAVARRAGRERDGEDGDAGAAHRGRGLRGRHSEIPLRRARRRSR